MSEQSDLELVFLSQQGDKAAFGQLVLRYQPMAQRLATRVIGNGDLAQELVQDAMLQAYLSLEKLNDPIRFKSWLYGIVLNVCRNDLRRRKVMCFSLEAMVGNFVDEPPLISGSSADPQVVAEQEELHAALLEAVDTLSPKNRLTVFIVLPGAVQHTRSGKSFKYFSWCSERAFIQISSSTKKAIITCSRPNSTNLTSGD